MDRLLFSVGGLFFAITLSIIYAFKSKQTGITNKIYKSLIVFLNIMIFAEIIAALVTYYVDFNNVYADITRRICLMVFISWIYNMVFYLVTIGKTKGVTNYKEFLSSKTSYKIVSPKVYLISLELLVSINCSATILITI